MARKPKLYIPLIVTFFDDDRIIAAGDGPTLLYQAMCLRAKAMGSDGRLSEAQISRLNRPNWRQELDRLAELELVIYDESTREWFIAAWFSYNEPMEAVYARRAADRERKKNSSRNPGGFPPDSARNPGGIPPDSGSQGKERKGKEREGSATHRYADDGSGHCTRCALPAPNRVHLRLVG
ncbi:MAG TPA: hypothetical protein VF174_11490 [Micromonosporaceae bacterium]